MVFEAFNVFAAPTTRAQLCSLLGRPIILLEDPAYINSKLKPNKNTESKLNRAFIDT